MKSGILLKSGWIALLVIIFWLACIPKPPAALMSINDKIGHFIIFAALGYSGFFLWVPKFRTGWIFLFLAIYGAVMEYTQYYVPGRSLSLFDWIMDIAGLIAAVGLIKLAGPARSADISG